MDNGFIFRATNQHGPACGTPPCIDEPADDANVFRSYFQNQYGEQWILTHDSATDVITVHSGDYGWDSTLTIKPLRESLTVVPEKIASLVLEVANASRSSHSPVVCGKDGPITMQAAERQWIEACMTVIEERRNFARLKNSKNN